MSDPYAVISIDGHAGAELRAYKSYLPSQWHDEFDAWAKTYVNPFADLQAPTAYRNWDSERRLKEHHQDGIVAEVLYPNTVPPFFKASNLTALPPTDAEYPQRWAGLQAHNRWVADFCAEAPGQRGGIVQVFLNDIEAAVKEIRWAKQNMNVFAGVMLPNVAPGTSWRPLWDPYYEPLWNVCEELEVVCNIHGGNGIPDYGDLEAARAIMLIELPWFAHRAIWHLIFSGVLENHPKMRCVLTEQGTGWIPRGLETLDWFYRRMTHKDAAEAVYFGAVAKGMTMKPSEYFTKHFWVGSSFLRPSEAALRYEVGVEKIMWGDDYPHSEGSYPYSREALRASFGGVPENETRMMVETTAANVYGFDLPMLKRIATEIGSPTPEEINVPLTPDEYPPLSTCNAFDKAQVIRSW